MAAKKRARKAAKPRKKPGQSRTPKKRRAPAWLSRFLVALAQTGNVSKAAEESGVARSAAYEYREKHPEFAAAWAEAEDVAADALELEARRRAHDGVNKPVIYKGELMGVWVDDAGEVVAETTPGAKKVPLTVKEYSDTLLIFLLKAHRPGKFRDQVEHKHDHRGEVQHEHGHTHSLDASPERLHSVLSILAEIGAFPAESPGDEAPAAADEVRPDPAVAQAGRIPPTR